MPALSEGRIVHYPVHGQCRAALVVRAWSPTVANLQVFLDGSNDDGHGLQVLAPGAIAWATSVVEATEENPLGWHWPERVEDTAPEGGQQ